MNKLLHLGRSLTTKWKRWTWPPTNGFRSSLWRDSPFKSATWLRASSTSFWWELATMRATLRIWKRKKSSQQKIPLTLQVRMFTLSMYWPFQIGSCRPFVTFTQGQARRYGRITRNECSPYWATLQTIKPWEIAQNFDVLFCRIREFGTVKFLGHFMKNPWNQLRKVIYSELPQ